MSIMNWTHEHMKLLQRFSQKVKKRQLLKDKTIAVVLHLEKKTATLIDALLDVGADVVCASCNPLTADPEIIDYLKEKNATVYAKACATQEEYHTFLDKILTHRIDAVIDDGADLIELLISKGITDIKGACEETTTGILRIKKLEKENKLLFPVIAVNDAHSKRLFDNVFGTGESTINGLLNATNLVIAGKTVAVIGYGHCGKGIAKRLKGLGARVVVVESDLTDRFGYSGYHKAMEAHFEGHEVMDAVSACRIADVIITATGNIHVIDEKHFQYMKDNVILANAGHFNVEINLEHLEKNCSEKKILTNSITRYIIKGKRINVLSQGRLVNLAKPSGQGHAIEIMDLSFSLQLLSVESIFKKKLPNKLLPVPKRLDIRVAKEFLKLKGIEVEELTKEQRKYLGVEETV